MKTLFDGQWPDLVLFDLDGTLVDSVPDLAAAVDAMLAQFGSYVAGQRRVETWVGNGAQTLVERALNWADLSEVSVADALACFLHHYEGNLAGASYLYKGVEPLLSGLKQLGVPMAVVTNKPIALTHPLLAALKIDHYFSAVVGGDSFAQKKPAPMPLLNVMETHQASADRTLMVGDSINDVAAARAAGCKVVAVTYGYNHGESIEATEPDKIVDRLDELL